MLPDDAFLRRLPISFEPAQRMMLEALVVAADTMEVALERLSHNLARFQLDEGQLRWRRLLFLDAWAIVDQVHAARQLMRRLSREFGTQPGEATTAYLNKHEAASLMRNWMDHLPERIPNRAAMVGDTSPMFGVLSCFRPTAEGFAEAVAQRNLSGEIVLVAAGSTPRNARHSLLGPDGDLRLPLCAIRLEAFDRILRLDQAVEELGPLLLRWSTGLQALFEEQIPGVALQLGQTVEEASRTAPEISAIVGWRIEWDE